MAYDRPLDPPALTIQRYKRPLYLSLAPIPITCFVGTLLTDIIFARTADMQWANMSAWLLTAGLIVSIVVVIIGLIDFFSERWIHGLRVTWIHIIGSALAIALSIFNALVHSRDAYTSVVPTGLTLSALVVFVLVATSWSGWFMARRHGVSVRIEERT